MVPGGEVELDQSQRIKWELKKDLQQETNNFFSAFPPQPQHGTVTMRLRLTVLRHRLPPTDFLWSISDEQTNTGTTISRFLTQIDEIVPLEAEHWGLEDYVVCVDNFECLHFQNVGNVLKEGDHVM